MRSRRSARRNSRIVPVKPLIASSPPVHRPRTRRDDVLVVVPQEQLLQRGGRSDHGPHLALDEVFEHVVELARVDAELRMSVLHPGVVHARPTDHRRQGLRGVNHDRGASEVAQLLERAALGRPPRPDDGDAVAQCFDLGENVAGQQDAATGVAKLLDDVLEHGLHEGVETGGRLVQQVQLYVRAERRHEGDLLSVALGVGADLLGRVELESLKQLLSSGRIETSPQMAERSITSPPVRFGHKFTSPGT